MREIPNIYADPHKKKKVVFGMPVNKGQSPHPKTIESLERSIPLVQAAGWEEGFTFTTQNPYISGARAEILKRALEAKADVIFFLDYDVAWEPEDLLKVLLAEGDVVAGVYRVKTDDHNEVLYMGCIHVDANDRPITRADGAIKAKVVPAGFLKVTTAAIDKFMREYPNLCYGPQFSLSVDLFQHGAHGGLWWGEDYAFSRNWADIGGDIWIIPDLNLDHWNHFHKNGLGGEVYRGNFHEYLLSQPGGSKDPARELTHA